MNNITEPTECHACYAPIRKTVTYGGEYEQSFVYNKDVEQWEFEKDFGDKSYRGEDVTDIRHACFTCDNIPDECEECEPEHVSGDIK